ncbi:cupin domain-containing protein [Roseibium sp. RKSG952]|uniref:cupin domain-containing protein n=1 Tax=Roseibium sp. RKSG952 TaxID=2529384 RepID=UPI0012BB7743|nr:cupin domain-containing protein [Roseibium sp. RKSG952]MTH95377.1 cupin [Roseibium sp. RKSG952]
MQIHADLTKRAVVDTKSLDWVASPIPGVERRMLERDGGEVARATSLVKYAPGSAFSAHKHDLGEEFLVLDGIFTDETGDFPKGMYVRNPPGSEHIPSSTPGAVILVKLRQMDPADRAYVRVDTRADGGWEDGRPGERILPLFEDRHETVSMLEWTQNASFDHEQLHGGAEYFVLRGSFSDQDGTYEAGTWLRIPAGSSQKISSPYGALLWRKMGHLL